MAIAVTVLKRYRYQWGGGYGIKDLLIEVTGDTSYPNPGGTAITPASLGVNSIIAVMPRLPYPLVNRRYLWDRSTGKLVGQTAAGTEVVGGTACNADKIVCRVFAR